MKNVWVGMVLALTALGCGSGSSPYAVSAQPAATRAAVVDPELIAARRELAAARAEVAELSARHAESARALAAAKAEAAARANTAAPPAVVAPQVAPPAAATRAVVGRQPVRYVNGLAFAGMPADALGGIEYSPTFSPGWASDDRDPVSGRLLSRTPAIDPIRLPRLAAVMGRYRDDATILINIEGTESFEIQSDVPRDKAGKPTKTWEEWRAHNHAAVLKWRGLLTVLRELKPRATFLVNILPTHSIEGAERHPDPAAYWAETRAINREVAEEIVWAVDAQGRPLCDALASQVYYLDRYGKGPHSDASAAAAKVANWWGNVPGDARELKMGWAHGAQELAAIQRAYGKPVWAVFAPHYAWGSRAESYEQPLTADDLTSCLAFLEKHFDGVYLWGTAKVGRVNRSPDGLEWGTWDGGHAMIRALAEKVSAVTR